MSYEVCWISPATLIFYLTTFFLFVFLLNIFSLNFKIKIYSICFSSLQMHSSKISILFLHKSFRLEIMILCSETPCICAYVHWNATFAFSKVFLLFFFTTSHLSPLEQFGINMYCGLTVLILSQIAENLEICIWLFFFLG